MSILDSVYEIARLLRSCPDLGTMQILFDHLTAEIGCDFYALHQHAMGSERYSSELRIHNYPKEWEEYYDRQRLGLADPVHRASDLMGCGFPWHGLAAIVPLGERDHMMLLQGQQFGLVDGFTVPLNVPGERPGSMTFAVKSTCHFSDDLATVLDGLARIAFQRVRALNGYGPKPGKPRITDRMLEIVVQVGQGKTNKEIGRHLGIKEDTVMKQIQNICRRLEAVGRASLPLRVVAEGLLTFSDIL